MVVVGRLVPGVARVVLTMRVPLSMGVAVGVRGIVLVPAGTWTLDHGAGE